MQTSTMTADTASVDNSILQAYILLPLEAADEVAAASADARLSCTCIRTCTSALQVFTADV